MEVENSSPFSATIKAFPLTFSSPEIPSVGLPNTSAAAGSFAVLHSPDLKMPTGKSNNSFAVPLNATDFEHFRAFAFQVMFNVDPSHPAPITIEGEPTLQVMILKLKVKLRKTLYCTYIPAMMDTPQDDLDPLTTDYLGPVSMSCVPANDVPTTTAAAPTTVATTVAMTETAPFVA